MKKIIVLLFVLALLIPSSVLADKRPPKNPKNVALAIPAEMSFFGSYGQRGYGSISKIGYVDMAAMVYDTKDIGFYSIVGDSFVGTAPALTLITGSCDHYDDPPRRMYAQVYVDGTYYKELFVTSDYVVSFFMPVYGQTFAIRIYIDGDTTIGCNVLLERLK